MAEIIDRTEYRKKNEKKNEDCLRDLWDNIKSLIFAL